MSPATTILYSIVEELSKVHTTLFFKLNSYLCEIKAYKNLELIYTEIILLRNLYMDKKRITNNLAKIRLTLLIEGYR